MANDLDVIDQIVTAFKADHPDAEVSMERLLDAIAARLTVAAPDDVPLLLAIEALQALADDEPARTEERIAAIRSRAEKLVADANLLTYYIKFVMKQSGMIARGYNGT